MNCPICFAPAGGCTCAAGIAMADAFFAALTGERNLQPDFVRAAARTATGSADFTRSAEEVSTISRMPLVGALAADPEDLAVRSRDNCEA